MSYRCGIGYDLHRLAEGRKLVIGGMEIPFDKGPVGHSDGDVVAHAMVDALLGAAGSVISAALSGYGPRWKGANSLLFLEHVKKLLVNKDLPSNISTSWSSSNGPNSVPIFPKCAETLANRWAADYPRSTSRPKPTKVSMPSAEGKRSPPTSLPHSRCEESTSPFPHRQFEPPF